MGEPTLGEPPLGEPTLARTPAMLGDGRELRLLPPATRYVLRGGDAVREAAERALGAPVATISCRAGAAGERAALWLGPDEWLLIGPSEAGGAGGAGFAATLGAALEGLPHSLVDVSHRQVAFVLSGAEATLLLAAGCPLDLDEQAFPVGMCTRTVLGKIEVVLWRTALDAFRIEVARSFAAYLSQFVAEAARGIK